MKDKRDISSTSTDSNQRAKTVEKLEKAYKGQYGKYMYYGGQVFVFFDGDVVNKTLLIQDEEPKTHFDRPYLKFKAKPVYSNDSVEDLKETIQDFKEEYEWFKETFKDIPNLVIPSENYSICNDPLGSSNMTVCISTNRVRNIKADIFRIGPRLLSKYIKSDASFKNTMVKLVRRFIELSEIDIYPDYLGVDNVAIYVQDNKPKIALIDPHIVWVGKECNDLVKGRLDRAIERFKKFLKDPEQYENIKFLTSDGLM